MKFSSAALASAALTLAAPAHGQGVPDGRVLTAAYEVCISHSRLETTAGRLTRSWNAGFEGCEEISRRLREDWARRDAADQKSIADEAKRQMERDAAFIALIATQIPSDGQAPAPNP